MEAGVWEDEWHLSQVAHHCRGTDEQEGSKKKLLEVGIIGEPQQDKLGN